MFSALKCPPALSFGRYIGFAGDRLKLTMVRASGDGAIQVTNGQIVAGANVYTVGPNEFEIIRKHCRDKVWVVFDQEFDPDWNMSEHTQSMAFFSNHNLVFSTASVVLTTKSGFKLNAAGVPEPYSEQSGSTTINVSIQGAKFREKVELSRRQVLSSIVGPCTTNQVHVDGGISYNVKWSGLVHYYFKHWHTVL